MSYRARVADRLHAKPPAQSGLLLLAALADAIIGPTPGELLVG